jgi:hypothetical protein
MFLQVEEAYDQLLLTALVIFYNLGRIAITLNPLNPNGNYIYHKI